MKRLIALFLALSVSYAHAQNPVITTPSGSILSNYSLTISSSSVFQNLFPVSTQTTGRIDCIIQNLSSHNMFIFFGVATAALTANSVTLAAGGTFRCNNGGVVIKNAISIGGTSGDNFFAEQ